MNGMPWRWWPYEPTREPEAFASDYYCPECQCGLVWYDNPDLLVCPCCGNHYKEKDMEGSEI